MVPRWRDTGGPELWVFQFLNWGSLQRAGSPVVVNRSAQCAQFPVRSFPSPQHELV